MPRRIISGTKMRRFPTRDFNEAVAAAQNQYRRDLSQGGAALGGIVAIRNDSGADVSEGDPLGIKSLMVEHADNEPEFRRMPGFLGTEPDVLDHALKWVIADEPIAEDQIGRAIYRGLCVAEVDVRNEYHTHARFRTDGDTDAVQLWSDFGGLARIVAKPDETGDQWCQLDMRADSSWIVEGFLTENLLFATVNGSVMEPAEAEGRVWQRNGTGVLEVNTSAGVTIENVSDTTLAPSGAYFRAQYDGFAWWPIWLDCAATALPGATT